METRFIRMVGVSNASRKSRRRSRPPTRTRMRATPLPVARMGLPSPPATTLSMACSSRKLAAERTMCVVAPLSTTHSLAAASEAASAMKVCSCAADALPETVAKFACCASLFFFLRQSEVRWVVRLQKSHHIFPEPCFLSDAAGAPVADEDFFFAGQLRE